MKSQRWAVVVFPGSNSDRDLLKAFSLCEKVEAVAHWHEDPIKPGDYQVIGIPGGFSFGDYLRAGAIAKLSKAILSLPDAVEKGAHAIGICNGFQILLESRLLPGFLQANQSLQFISKDQTCRVESEIFPWFQKPDAGRELLLPIAHGYGNYQCKSMDRGEIQVALSYKENPNGSVDSIAGIYRRMGSGSLFGLMPHPERAAYAETGKSAGALFWKNAEGGLS